MRREGHPFQRIGLLGLGAMGCSLGLALRRIGTLQVTGYDPSPAGRKALARGAVQNLAGSAEEAVAQADLVVLAMPAHIIVDEMSHLAAMVTEGTLVTDLGSSKKVILEAAAEHLPATVHFIGGHPMAGTEKAGAGAGDGGLFAGHAWVLCPPATETGDGLRRLEALIVSLGAVPVVMPAAHHDRVLAAISHLPQLAAVALLNVIGGGGNPQEMIALAGGGFRDMTRIGGSSYEMWQGILKTNAAQVRQALTSFIGCLQAMEHELAAGGREPLAAAFRSARATRDLVAPKVLPDDGEA